MGINLIKVIIFNNLLDLYDVLFKKLILSVIPKLESAIGL